MVSGLVIGYAAAAARQHALEPGREPGEPQMLLLARSFTVGLTSGGVVDIQPVEDDAVLA